MGKESNATVEQLRDLDRGNRTVEGSKKSTNKELGEYLAKILQEIKKIKKPDSLFVAIAKKIFSAVVKKLSPDKDKDGKSKKGEVAKDRMTKGLEQDLEIAVIKLQSISRNNSDMNDLAMLQSISQVLKLSAELSARNPSFSVEPPKMVQKASFAISNLDVAIKNETAGLLASTVSTERLMVDRESSSQANSAHMESNVSPMIKALRNASAGQIEQSAVPITEEAKKKKAKEFAEYVSPTARSSDGA